MSLRMPANPVKNQGFTGTLYVIEVRWTGLL
nr:MAG TPA: hypothetical protein [Caudoviricetes sp.]